MAIGGASYKVFIDLDNGGTFADPGEEFAADVRAGPGITIRSGREQSLALAPPAAADAHFVLGNQSGDYDPGTNLKKGRLCRIQRAIETSSLLLEDGSGHYQLEDGSGNYITEGLTAQNFFTGRLLKPEYVAIHGGDSLVRLSAVDMMTRLVGQRITTALHAGITVDAAIGAILDALDWPAGDRDLDTGVISLSYWWAADEDAYGLLLQLLNTEGPTALAYVDGDGVFVFRNRTYATTNARAVNVQYTLRGSGDDPRFSGMEYDDGLDNVANAIGIAQRTRSAEASGTLWELTETVTLGANEVREWVAKLDHPAVSGTPSTSMTLISGSGSHGAVSPTGGSYGTPSGQLITVRVTADAGGMSFSTLRLLGELYSTDFESVVSDTRPITAATQTSQDEHGIRQRSAAEIPTRAEITSDAALALADLYLAHYVDGTPRLKIRVPGGTDARYQVQFAQMGDRVRIIKADSPMDMDIECWVQAVEHEIKGGLHSVILGVEQVP